MEYKKMREYTHEEFVNLILSLNEEQLLELSARYGGYPVLFRMALDDRISHIPFIQTGSAIIIRNENGQILLQERTDRNKWGLPGGCQELGETFEEVVIREVKEETNLDVREEDLKLIKIVSGMSRRSSYPNGDVVINNTVLYLVDKYSGSLRWNSESKDMKFFDLDKLPRNQHDPDLIDTYIKYLNK